MLTLQEVMDFSMHHIFIIQGGKRSLLPSKDSIYPSGFCGYRGKDGMKCGVGCLIDDEHYDAEMEGVTIDVLTDSGEALSKKQIAKKYHLKKALENSGIQLTPPTIELLKMLQHVHDTEDETVRAEWINDLEIISKRYDLSFDKSKSYVEQYYQRIEKEEG